MCGDAGRRVEPLVAFCWTGRRVVVGWHRSFDNGFVQLSLMRVEPLKSRKERKEKEFLQRGDGDELGFDAHERLS